MTKSGSLRNSMQKCGKILPGRKDTRAPRGFNIAGASDPAVPTPLCVYSVGLFVIKTRFAFLLVKMDLATDTGSDSEQDQGEYYGGHLGFLQNATCYTHTRLTALFPGQPG